MLRLETALDVRPVAGAHFQNSVLKFVFVQIPRTFLLGASNIAASKSQWKTLCVEATRARWKEPHPARTWPHGRATRPCGLGNSASVVRRGKEVKPDCHKMKPPNVCIRKAPTVFT